MSMQEEDRDRQTQQQQPQQEHRQEHLDVLVVGAGLSGIGAGYHLQAKCPGRSYAILEGRERSGGTWDLFRYPGVRSDSDMYTLGSFLPSGIAYGLTRWKNVLLAMYFFRLARRRPERVKRLILGGVRQALGPGYDVATHFTPRYNPWDQRLCLVPDGDLFAAIRAGRASMVTDHVDTFTPGGIRLKSGRELQADVIVTATGLELQVLGGVRLEVDGRSVDPAATFNYKGMMYSDVPNLASSFGYTNASWTLKSDLTCAYVCRVLNHMEKHGWRQCTPRNTDPSLVPEPWLDFSSGYVQRAVDRFPKQGSRAPWRVYQNYARDLVSLRFGSVDDGVMEFANPRAG
ncbi:flavin-containing monooxygenase [Variovorax sp. 22077]|uniref:flavin-containing monooxygenase n=1 Tax=Variovorax sp. 22077 TaxID=3453867 RepID=UPI003F85690E